MNRKTTLITTLLIITLSLTAITLARASTPGTVAVWHFDEGTGSTATDATGNGNDGTLSGGKFGNALYFDGTDDYVTILDSPSLDAIEDLTVELWVKPSVDYTAGPVFYVFASKFTPSTSFQFCYHTEGYLYLYVSNGIAVESTPLTLTADNWYHLAATFDSGAANGQIFVNGVDVTSSTSVRTMTENDQPLCIGVRADDLDHEVKGILDEVRVSDTIRYSTGFAVPTGPFSDDSDTVGLWHFDESTGATAYDSSSNNNDGTIIGATWAGPTWTNGYFGKALNFDGVDDYVILDDNEFSDPELDEYTFESWIYIESLDGVERRIFDDEGGLRPMLTSGNKLEAFHWDSTAWTGKKITWSTTPATATWYHIAQTYDGSDLKFYINGDLVGTLSCDAWEPDGLNREVNLGTWWQGLGRNWKGLIDETRIWDHALSVDTIKQHKCLVGEWDFDENTGTTAHDTSGFENHGTITNPNWVTGYINSGLNFDTTSYVDCGEYVDTALSNEITLEAWINPTGIQRGGIISSDVTYYAPHKGYDFFLWDHGTYGRIYIDFGDGSTLGRQWWDIPSNEWHNQWHHVAASWDGTATRLFIDGAEVNLLSYTGTYADPDRNTLIGAISYNSVIHKFNGKIDEVKIWACAKYAPVADANGPYTGDEGSPINLDGSASWDDKSIVSYEWDLDNDGYYDDASGVSVAHTWYDNGFYTIGLKVTDDEGYWSTDSTTVTINNVAPSITSISGDTVSENDVATVSGAFTDPGALDTFTVTIDWGEGSPEPFSYPAGSTSFSETHQYLDDDPTGTPSDVYTVSVTVTDDDGGVAIDSTTVTVNNVAPTISSVTGDTINENGVATVSGAFTDPGALDTFTVTIDWGEGSPEPFSYPAGSTSFSETHQYLDDDPTGTPSDVYTVSVTVTDDDTGSDTDSTSVTVNNVAPTVEAGDGITTQINLPTMFSGTFTDPGTLDTHTYRWIWGDGSTATMGTLTPTHTYATAGVYTVTLEVTDDDTGLGSDTLRVVVLQVSDITDSGLCPDFDKDEADGDQFRIIYTPDVSNDPSTYKLTATNPGQFYYNVFHVGTITAVEPLMLSIPYPFETQGANPIHVYDGVDIISGCYVPGDDITDQFDIAGYGCALEFDGVNDYLEIPAGVFDATDSYTFEAWIYLKDNGVDTWRGFFRRGQEGEKASEIEIYTQPYDSRAGRLTVVHNRLGALGAYSYKYFTTFPREEWVHLAVTYDGSTFRSYYNGVEQPQYSGISETDAHDGGQPSYIGIGYYQAYMNGMIDEVRLSNTVHTSFEITKPPEVESDTIALWHFDECKGQTVMDATSEHDLYLGSTAGEDDNDPTWSGAARYGVVPTSTDFGVYYMNIHLDYGLKKTTGYVPQPYDENDLQKAHAKIVDDVVIPDLETYDFSVSGPVSDSQTVQSRNVFKKIRGIIGYIAGATEGDEVEITGPDWEETVLVDEDGFYGHSFHHKGKEFYYTIDPEGYPYVDVPIKAGKLAEVNFPYE